MVSIYVVLSIFISIVATRTANQDKFHFPPYFAVKHAEMMQKCVQETKVSPDEYEKKLTWDVTDDEATKNFVYCFGTKLKLADEDGHIIADRLTTLLGSHPRFQEFKSALAECNKIIGKDNHDTIFLVSKCIHEEGPIAFTL